MDLKAFDKKALDELAGSAGVAVAVVDDNGREVSSANNNSICQNLNPDGVFSPDCSKFCGKAMEKALEAGGTIGFECHAGLDCRASVFKRQGKQFVAIVGRVFVKADNYRRATQRAIAGDWNKYPPSQFFENILLTGSDGTLDKALTQVNELLAEASEVRSDTEANRSDKISSTPPETQRSREPEEPRGGKSEITNLVEKFNREVRQVTPAKPAPTPAEKPVEPPVVHATEPQPKQDEKRTAEARAWRSFFGSLLKMDYPRACSSILQFLAHQYGFSSLIWLEARSNRFENTAAFGDLQNRKVRLGLAADDRRLVEALQNEVPLELGERTKGPEGTRTMYLFPVGIGSDISAAVAILDRIKADDVKKQIARICHSIAPQLEILRLRNEVASGRSFAGAVRRFSESIKRIDSDDFWLVLTQNTAEMLRAERASLMIFDEAADNFDIKSIIGSKHRAPEAEIPGTRVARIVMARNEAVIVTDIARTSLAPMPQRGYKTPSFLSCPINIGGRTIGVMNFTDLADGGTFDKRSLEMFQAIAPQLAVAIDRAALKEKAGEFEQLSVTDPLTGLLNRRYIEQRLLEEVKRSNRHGFPMSFMMLDVDHFKSYNDHFGHPAGDEALKLVAHVMKETLRGADVAARFGGEEFSILLPQTTGEEAAAIAERIRANIENTKFEHRSVTTSIGVASCSAELCASADLISAADKALYEAKRQGRNRVLIYENMTAAKNGK